MHAIRGAFVVSVCIVTVNRAWTRGRMKDPTGCVHGSKDPGEEGLQRRSIAGAPTTLVQPRPDAVHDRLESAMRYNEESEEIENDPCEEFVDNDRGGLQNAAIGSKDWSPTGKGTPHGSIAIGVLAASSENEGAENDRDSKDLVEEAEKSISAQASLSGSAKKPALASNIPLSVLADTKGSDLERQKSVSSISMASGSSGIDLDEKTRNTIARSTFARAQRLRGRDTAGASMDRMRSSKSVDAADVESGIATSSRRAPTIRPSDEKLPLSRLSSRTSTLDGDVEVHCMPANGVLSTPSLADGSSNSRETSQIATQGTAFVGSDGSEQGTHCLGGVDSVDLPGAFAVSGRRRRNLSAGYDSGYDDSASEQDSSSIVEETGRILRNNSPVAPEDPLDAELYEEQVQNARVVSVESEKDERRRRIFRGVSILASVVLLTAIVLAVALTQQGGDDGNTGFETNVPLVAGWDQVGETLLGPTNQDNIRFGFAVALSGEGNRLAVGLPGLDDRDDNSVQAQGSVFILDFNGTDWLKVGRIDGFGQGSEAGTALRLSYDGNRVAFGCPGGSAKDGYVAVYEETDVGLWGPVGDLIVGVQGGGQEFGSSLAFASDGRSLAAGAKFASRSNGTLANVGSVRVFSFNNDSWTPIGNTIYGEKAGDLFGWAVAMSADGFRIAGTALGANSFAGKLTVYDYADDRWSVVGGALEGTSERENFGVSVALSGDGKIVAVGANGFSIGSTLVGAGCARLFRLGDDEESWELTSTVSGDAAFDRFGSSVALSYDGNKCAIGGPENDDFGGSNAGHVRVLERNADGRDWVAIGSALGDVENIGGHFGTSVALSATGSRVVIGAPLSTFDGFRSEVGRAWVYDVIGTRSLF